MQRQQELLPRMGKEEKFGLDVGVADTMSSGHSHKQEYGCADEGFVGHTADPINLGLFQLRRKELEMLT